MGIIARIKATPNGQKYRYLLIMLSCSLFFAPFMFLPSLVDNPDLCGKVCIRRFYLFFPGMSLEDVANQVQVASVGVYLLLTILVTTFFFGRMWCAYLCPVGGFPELVSRTMSDRWKIEYRALPQVPIRYGYFSVYLVLMPMLGISACTLCNFITVPRIFEALSGEIKGVLFIISAVGLVNLGLLFLLGFFAVKGRAYCQFLCPIGALDGLVNRLGSMFRFTRHIRVERNRCTGCSECARKCMTGAIRMRGRIAVVDQLSCMSCHECVDVCDWGAIDWRAAPLERDPKRKKKGVEFHPQPQWQAIHFEPEKKRDRRRRLKAVLRLLLIGVAMAGFSSTVMAEPRHADPDGCFSCHGLAGLEYVDKNGVLRSATIDKAHYYGSLHGGVPCRDCHRKIKSFPHRIENGEVDCAATCHVEEPSRGEPYSHKQVVKEFQTSVHGKGWSKGLTGANRLQESKEGALPSCRKCHQNDPYIDPEALPKFKEAFDHLDSECGRCHQGEVWLGQSGGHILRRFIGSRWNKRDHNRMCNDCHADHQRMARVERKEGEAGEKKPVGPRFILASDSYAMTLHARLLDSGVEAGASCIDCHAPSGLHHAIRRDDDPKSSTHQEHLAETCGQSNCHAYATDPLNRAFVETDMHDIDMVPVVNEYVGLDAGRLGSAWIKALLVLGPIVLVVGVLILLGALLGKRKKGNVYAVLGGDSFQNKVLGRPVRKKKKPRRAGRPSKEAR